VIKKCDCQIVDGAKVGLTFAPIQLQNQAKFLYVFGGSQKLFAPFTDGNWLKKMDKSP
jgi:hypothetical protein